MTYSGELLLGAGRQRGAGAAFQAVEAATGDPLPGVFHAAGPEQILAACRLADAAFNPYRSAPLAQRAALLDAVAEAIMALGDELILRAMAESGLPRARLEGERGRTVAQLKMFSAVVREGSFQSLRFDPGQPERTPAPRPDLRLRKIPLGPVAVFGASNFPLAFSVAGGDTASALAAGCPVVAKAHPAHPGVSELVGAVVQAAIEASALPEGVFSLLFDDSHAVGHALVMAPQIAAVGFTGSRRGGLALVKAAASRPSPIPVYAEMSSINPVILAPGALATRPEKIAAAFAAALSLGGGQFCTNPGLVLAIDGPGLDTFMSAAAREIQALAPAVMLTPAILQAYEAGVQVLEGHVEISTLARGRPADRLQGCAGLFATSAEAFLSHPELQDEVFGAASLIVRCRDESMLHRVITALEGQLTASLHLDAADSIFARRLLPSLERKVGRILANGFGTGVEVASAMVHGGPFPATSDSRSTSVGTLAIDRFLRPVSYQDLPSDLLPEVLRNAPGAPQGST